MTTNQGDPILPSVSHKNATKHFDSLNILKQFTSCTLLLSHGNAMQEKEMILNAIEQRQTYIKAVAESAKPIDLYDALKDCDIKFLHTEWHEYVYA